MKTTLPDLSYDPTGIVWTTGPHSSAYSGQRAYPRTDLRSFLPWDGFETEVDDAINAHMVDMNILPGTEYDVGAMPKKPQVVAEEEDVRREAKVQLHDLVVEVLGILGIEGHFLGPSSGNNYLIGAPDFSWLRDNIPHPLLVVRGSLTSIFDHPHFMVQAEYKTKWAAPLADLPEYFRQQNRSVLERQSIDAVYQVYGYMTFNENKYGVLSNMEYAWFFQRAEEGQSLRYHGPISVDPASSPSMLKAFVGIILLANDSWFHSSPFSAARTPPSRYFGTSITATRDRNAAITRAQHFRSPVVDGYYQLLPLDPRLCHFERSSVRHAPQRGFTVKAKLETGIFTKENVFCKIVDIFQNQDSCAALSKEARNYATLENLQGVAIPRVRGRYNIWGLLGLLVLEDVGTAIPEGRPIRNQMRTKMRAALSHIHSAGYVHGDIARRNFCMKGNLVFLVDLETLALGTPAERANELAVIDTL